MLGDVEGVVAWPDEIARGEESALEQQGVENGQGVNAWESGIADADDEVLALVAGTVEGDAVQLADLGIGQTVVARGEGGVVGDGWEGEAPVV